MTGGKKGYSEYCIDDDDDYAFSIDDVDKYVTEFVEEIFEEEIDSYKSSVEYNLKDGKSFIKSFEDLEDYIKWQIKNVENELFYPELRDCFQNIEKDFEINKLTKAAYSKKFQFELESNATSLNMFLDNHVEYLAYNEVLKFHYQNKAVFERYFKIKYNDKLKNRVKYDELILCKGDPENDSKTIAEWTRLEEILNPPKKKAINRQLQKRGLKLSTKDVAVFMILFKDYYKIKFNSYVEFTELSRLFFDDLHFNMEAGDAKLGTSIKRYIKGEDLFAGDFNFDSSKNKVFDILTGIDLKGFKKYIEKVEINKFKKLLK